MAKQQTDKYMLALAGEYAVCSELLKRGISCCLTFGNAKATDIFLTKTGKTSKSWIVEVKTSMSKRFVTGFFQKYPTPQSFPRPDFWVLVQIDEMTHVARFYVMSHKEMAAAQMARNKVKSWTAVKNGVDNVLLNQIEQYENHWEKIQNSFFTTKSNHRQSKKE